MLKAMGLFAALVLILQPLIFYHRHLFRLDAHIPFDIAYYHLPLAAFIERSVTRHVWPLWNPQVYSGFPVHADITAGLFYPFTWLAIIADKATGGGRLFYWLEWLVPLHMMFAGIGAYLLLRQLRCSVWVALFGATVFQISPFFVSQAQHLGAISTAAWFPFILLFVCRLADEVRPRRAAFLAIAIALTILAGFPAAMIVVLVLSTLFCFALIQARLAKLRLLVFFAASCLGGIAMTAIQLIPTIQLSRLSVASLRYKWFGDGGGMHWQSFVSFIRPDYYGIFTAWDPSKYKLPYNYTFMFTFCGYATAVLIAAALILPRKTKVQAISLALFLLSAIWMLGAGTPVYPAIYHMLPHFLENAMYPEFALLGFSMFAACTAALALAGMESAMPRFLIVVLVAANSWNLIRVGANRVFNTFDGGYRVVTAGWKDGERSMPDALREMTRETQPPSRIEFFSAVGGLLELAPGVFDIPSAAGDNPFLLLRYYDLRHSFSDNGPWNRRQYPRGFEDRWLQALDVGYVLEDKAAPERTFDPEKYERTDLRSVHVYRVKSPQPRFYIQNRVVTVKNEQEALVAAVKGSIDPPTAAIVENLPKDWRPDAVDGGSVKVLEYDDNRIVLQAHTGGRAMLVTSEPLYPGWTATINGKAASIVPANVAFRGIPLDAGENQIVMQYKPQNVFIAAVISLLASIVVMCGLAVGDRALT
jgi:hypothetical protein